VKAKTLLEVVEYAAQEHSKAISDKQLPKEAYKEGYMLGYLHGSNSTQYLRYSEMGRNKMYIPLGKALVPVEQEEGLYCSGCYYNESGEPCGQDGACDPNERADGKDIIFKMVDYPEE